MNNPKTDWGITRKPTPPQPEPFIRVLTGKYARNDYPEDAAHENGSYATKCRCGTVFIGHKRRVFCKVCAESAPPQPEPQRFPPCSVYKMITPFGPYFCELPRGHAGPHYAKSFGWENEALAPQPPPLDRIKLAQEIFIRLMTQPEQHGCKGWEESSAADAAFDYADAFMCRIEQEKPPCITSTPSTTNANMNS